MACENFRDVYHFSNIRTCSTVELLTLSTLLLSISYLIVISSGFFVWYSLVFFFFCPGCTESSVSWQNFLSARLNPLLPLSCFRKSPRSQMTRGGKETFTMMWEIPSQEKKIKEDRHKGPFCPESGTWRPAINWAGLVHDGNNITSLGTQWARLLQSSEARVSHAAVCSGPAVSWAKRLIPDTKLAHHAARCLYIEVECVACIVPLHQLLKWKGSTAQWNK